MREFVSVVVSDGTRDAGLAMMLLTRPPANRMTRQVYREIVEAADELSVRSDVTAVIVFGGHEIFSVGDDETELRTLDHAGRVAAMALRQRAFRAVAAISKPTVAAITGYALGSGLALALATDWRVSGDNAKFGATEILDDRAPSPDAMVRLGRCVGVSRAKEMMFSGRFVGAEEALGMGLVEELVAPDGVYDAAAQWARQFLETAPTAMAAVKAEVNAVFEPEGGPEHRPLRCQ